MCRHESKELIVTREAPCQGEYTFDLKALRHRKSLMVFNRALGVRVDGDILNGCIDKLHQYCCPSADCWSNGEQQPFRMKEALREHMAKVHGVDYCTICLDHRPVFMSEQQTYADKERDAHNRGECPTDPESFVGHPMCYFCNRRFYDGEHLLKHLQHNHFSCDLCNRGEYTFTFYKNRPKLLEHFSEKHKLCEHAHCKDLDPMLRVFHSDFELQSHMQTAHGSASKEISLESLGFRFGGGGSASSNANAAPSARNGPVQTGSNVVATFVKFDHIHRMDRVELEPTGRRAGKGRAPRGRAKNAANPEPIPSHYLTSAQQFAPILLSLDDQDTPPTSPNTANANILVSKKRDSRRSDAFGSQPTRKSQPVDVLKHLPSGGDDRKRLLAESVNRILGKGSGRHSHFSKTLDEYRSGRLFATEFYKTMRQTFANSSEMDEVFPLVAGTIEDPAKQNGLLMARAMLSSQEMQKQEKIKEEECQKANEERIISELRAKRIVLGSSKRPAKNAWNSGSNAPATPPVTSPVSKAPQKPQGVWAQAAVNTPSSAAAAMASAPTLGSFVDPSDFPALATSGPSRRWPTSNAGAQKPGAKGNAWFGKKK